MKYIMLFLMVIMLNACESAQNFKRPELSQQNCDTCNIDDAASPIGDDEYAKSRLMLTVRSTLIKVLRERSAFCVTLKILASSHCWGLRSNRTKTYGKRKIIV